MDGAEMPAPLGLCAADDLVFDNSTRRSGDRKMSEGFAASLPLACRHVAALDLPVSLLAPLRGLTCENTPRATPRSGKTGVLLTKRATALFQA
jgi:hypothetical protein